MSTLTTACWLVAAACAGYALGLHRMSQRYRAALTELNKALEYAAGQLNGYIAARTVEHVAQAFDRGDTATAIGILLGQDHPLMDQPMTDDLEQQITDAVNAKLEQLAATISAAPRRMVGE